MKAQFENTGLTTTKMSKKGFPKFSKKICGRNSTEEDLSHGYYKSDREIGRRGIRTV